MDVKDNIVPFYFGRFLGRKIKLEEASEPSDIIWENREVTNRFRKKCRVCVWIAITIMLAISGCIIYVCSYTSNSLKFRYPLTDCVVSDKLYKGHEEGYMEDAFKEFLINQKLLKGGYPTNYKNTMQCFCRKNKEDQDKKYKITINGKEIEKAFCASYFSDTTTSKVLGTSISFIIIAINLVLKNMIIYLI